MIQKIYFKKSLPFFGSIVKKIFYEKVGGKIEKIIFCEEAFDLEYIELSHE